MAEQLKKHTATKGRPSQLSVEDHIFLCLSYWREYRTLFQVATSFTEFQNQYPQELYAILKTV
ncbi:transposase family protein [Acinetobacter sp.]|uniref:transposase family protein n=1 Tax=Acinetobacter sp. TaxID=472 RepID=UPI003D064DBF